MSAVVLAAAVWAAHYAYYLRDDLVWRAWAQYIGSHAALAVLSLLLVPMAARARQRLLAGLGMGSCYLMAIESAQCVTCGALEFGQVVERDLCLQAWGSTPYAVAASMLGATLAVRRWRARHG